MEVQTRSDRSCKRKRDDHRISKPMATSTYNTSSPSDSLQIMIDYDIVTVKQWLNGWSRNTTVNGDLKKDRLPLVDLRTYEEFNKRHLHSTDEDISPIVNLPLDTLLSGERSCELPPRHVDFAILVPNNYAEQFSSCNSQCRIHSLFFASKSSATQQSRKPWLVRQVILENEHVWDDEIISQHIERNTNVNDESKSNAISFRPLPRLWKPDPLVSSELLPLLKMWINKNCFEPIVEGSHHHMPCTVFDLGSGAGRDVCYLAEETKAFYSNSTSKVEHKESQYNRFPLHFVGVDNHKGSARRCGPLWRNRGIDDVTTSHLLNLNRLDLVKKCFTNTMYTDPTSKNAESRPAIVCIYAIRFLNRKLFSLIASSTSSTDKLEQETSTLNLPEGTIVGISHFCKPSKNAEWNFDHPKECNVLDREEMRDLFGKSNENKWRILKDDIIMDGDHGRTLLQFIAKKIS